MKIDIQDFFENISERQVYRILSSLGYSPLVAFELTRLCTTTIGGSTRADFSVLESALDDFEAGAVRGGLYHRLKAAKRYLEPLRCRMQDREGYEYSSTGPNRWLGNANYTSGYRTHATNMRFPQELQFIGHLPQGAPTSPMLANLAMLSFDTKITEIASQFGFIFTRYCDDLTFSSCLPNINRRRIGEMIRLIYRELQLRGLSPAPHKTTIAGPGSRKVVLGLLVDGDRPRLSHRFRDTLDAKLYHLIKHGFDCKAQAIFPNMDTIAVLQHLKGLIEFARSIDSELVENQGWQDSLDRFIKMNHS